MAGPPSHSSIPTDGKLRINRDFSLELSKSERELQALRQQVYNLAARLERYSGGIYKPLLLHMLEEKGRLGLLPVVLRVPAVFNMPGAIAPYHQYMWLCPKMDVIYHYYLAASAAHVAVVNPGIGYPVFWGPSPFVELSYRRAEVLEQTNSQDEEVAQDWMATGDHENAETRPGLDATYQQTLWACPEPQDVYYCYSWDAAAAYAGAYPAGVGSGAGTGASCPVGWGPSIVTGRPYRRAQVVELPETSDEEEEAEQDRAAPAEECGAHCGPGLDATYQQTLWACPEPQDVYYCYSWDATAYAGAYPAGVGSGAGTGASCPVGWGPDIITGRPYRRAQVVELHETSDEEEEAEQDRAAPAEECGAHCGGEHTAGGGGG